eukprot:216886_1
MIGRYANDVYPGCNTGGGSQGHSWILCSNALADYYYRVCDGIYDSENVLNSKYLQILSNLFKKDQPKISKLFDKYSAEWNTFNDELKNKKYSRSKSDVSGFINIIENKNNNNDARELFKRRGVGNDMLGRGYTVNHFYYKFSVSELICGSNEKWKNMLKKK